LHPCWPESIGVALVISDVVAFGRSEVGAGGVGHPCPPDAHGAEEVVVDILRKINTGDLFGQHL
jgi:hypothetical protein